jgi:hypothetical protein
VAAATALRDLLQAALDAVASGAVTAQDLAAPLPQVNFVEPPGEVTPHVQEILARNSAARTALERQTARSEAAVVVLRIAAALWTLLNPLTALLKALLPVVLAALCLAKTGCVQAGGVGPGAIGPPHVQVTASAPAEAVVVKPGALMVQPGAVSPQAIQAGLWAVIDRLAVLAADLELRIGPGAKVTSPEASWSASQPTSQVAQASGDQAGAGRDLSAGRDVRPVALAVNLSGSAWPSVALVGLAGFLLVLWLRASAARREGRMILERTRREARQIEDGLAGQGRAAREDLLTVALAVLRLGPGRQRDRLLRLVAEGMDAVQRDRFDGLLKARGLYVSRRQASGGPALRSAQGGVSQSNPAADLVSRVSESANERPECASVNDLQTRRAQGLNEG